MGFGGNPEEVMIEVVGIVDLRIKLSRQ